MFVLTSSSRSMICAACSDALGIGRIDWLSPAQDLADSVTHAYTHYLSRYLSAAFA